MKIGPHLPDILKSSETWNDLIEIADDTINSPTMQRIRQLRDRRNIDNLIQSSNERVDRIGFDSDETKIITSFFAYTLGFHYRNLEGFDNDTYIRFIDKSVEFASYNGTSRFIDFLSYVIDSDVRITYLWYDKTAETLVAPNDVTTIGRRLGIDGFNADVQNVYPTPYVSLDFDPAFFATSLGLSNRDVQELFYSIAPIDHVIDTLQISTTLEDFIIKIHPGPVEEKKFEITVIEPNNIIHFHTTPAQKTTGEFLKVNIEVIEDEGNFESNTDHNSITVEQTQNPKQPVAYTNNENNVRVVE